jgi:hypothetical protein
MENTVEFRLSSWLSDDVLQLLDRQGALVCLHDMVDAGATEQPNDATFVCAAPSSGFQPAAVPRSVDRLDLFKCGPLMGFHLVKSPPAPTNFGNLRKIGSAEM